MTPRPVDRSEVLALLRRELRAVNAAVPEDVAPDAELVADLHLDSLDVVEFVARVEEAYRFSVPDGQWQQLSSLERIASYVLSQLPE